MLKSLCYLLSSFSVITVNWSLLKDQDLDTVIIIKVLTQYNLASFLACITEFILPSLPRKTPVQE